ncbi:MAG: response regulator transcription factor [Janthinobacterium lividum]
MKIACYIPNTAVFEPMQHVLARGGYECIHFDTEAALLRNIRRNVVSLIIIDIGSEPRDDDGILAWLNQRIGDRTPVLITSSVRDAELAATALNSGADDFLVRPCEPIELLARVNALMRRCMPVQARRSLELAGFNLDLETSKCTFEKAPIELTPREFSMAWLLFSSPGIYISRNTIGAVIWGADSEVAGRTIEQHVYKLRKKLQSHAMQSVMIRTAYTQGYRLEVCAGNA